MEREEFTRRIQAMMERLYRITYGQLREPQDRMDAVQEALAKAWAARNRLKQPEYFETWVIRILLNECHNIQRKRRYTEPLDNIPDVPEETFNGDIDLRNAILSLPEKYRTPIQLHYMEGYKVEEVAGMLHAPQETVRSWLRRARASLKKMLE